MAKWMKGVSGNPAGRPKGVQIRRTWELRETAKRLGCDPLEVMIDEIKDLLAHAKRARGEKRRELRTQAVEVASRLAPYLHPKLASIELTGDDERPIAVHALDVRARLLREIEQHAAVIEHEPVEPVGNGEAVN
jgi:hypothetical protein